MLRKLLWISLLLPLPAFAQQQLINCLPSIPCATSSPVGSGLGDAPYLSSGKTNANFTQLYGMYGPSSSLATTGVPSYLDLLSLWSGTKDGSHCAGGNGVMIACAGGGSWSTLTGGTNTSAAFVVGSGASLGATGTGVITATNLSAVTGLPSQAGYSFIGNCTSSSGTPTACTAQQAQAALIAANATTISDSPAAGPLVAYSPSGWGTTVAVLDVTPTSGGTTICSLVAGSDKQDVILKNVGTAPIFVENECSSDSTAANRIDTGGNFMIGAGGQARLTYVTATSRWNLL